ncbi:MAG TPA: DinB family protein [Actinocatenispora sp.]
MHDVLLDPFRHNGWATRELIAFCRPLSAGQLAATGVGTFGDIPATLDHIVRCDASYAARMADHPFRWVDEATADLDVLDDRAVEVGRVWEDVLAAPIDTERVIVVDDGAHATRAGIFLAQALNHANHHREQVCAILTGLGFASPDIQAWEYAWRTGRIWDR